ARYRARRERLAAVVAEHLPGCRLRGLPAGLQAVLEPPARADEGAGVAPAARHGLAPLPPGAYPVDTSAADAPAVVVGYGAPRDHQVERAFDALVRAVRPVATRARGT